MIDAGQSALAAHWGTGTGLPAIRAAAARHHFQTLDFLAHGFVEGGVGQEDKPVGAGVGMVVLAGFAWAKYARLCGVHSLHPFCGPGSGVLPAPAGPFPWCHPHVNTNTYKCI